MTSKEKLRVIISKVSVVTYVGRMEGASISTNRGLHLAEAHPLLVTAAPQPSYHAFSQDMGSVFKASPAKHKPSHAYFTEQFNSYCVNISHGNNSRGALHFITEEANQETGIFPAKINFLSMNGFVPLSKQVV